MTLEEVMQELASYGNEQTKKVFLNHGAKEPFFGVKVGDMKKIVKKVKKHYNLSLQLFETGNSDAMYLAGLIADEKQMTKKDLQKWLKGANWYMLSEYTVPWIAAESSHGWDLGLEWIESNLDNESAAGWATLANVVALQSDEDLDLKKLEDLLLFCGNNIHNASNRTRYAMNGFVISVGGYVVPLSKKAMEIADKIGKVQVEMGGTACKVPLATAYIQKMIDKDKVGKKKKKARC